jgi:hypothetical protein
MIGVKNCLTLKKIGSGLKCMLSFFSTFYTTKRHCEGSCPKQSQAQNRLLRASQ